MLESVEFVLLFCGRAVESTLFGMYVSLSPPQAVAVVSCPLAGGCESVRLFTRVMTVAACEPL